MRRARPVPAWTALVAALGQMSRSEVAVKVLTIAMALWLTSGCSSRSSPYTREPLATPQRTRIQQNDPLSERERREIEQRGRDAEATRQATEAAAHSRSKLTPATKAVLTQSEIDLFEKAPPPGRTFQEGLRLRGAAMLKVVEADPRYKHVRESLLLHHRTLVSELAESDPSAETVGRSIARQLRPDIEAALTVMRSVYAENGWENPLSEAESFRIWSDNVAAQATDDVLKDRISKRSK